MHACCQRATCCASAHRPETTPVAPLRLRRQTSQFEQELAGYLRELKLPPAEAGTALRLLAAHDFSAARGHIIASGMGSAVFGRTWARGRFQAMCGQSGAGGWRHGAYKCRCTPPARRPSHNTSDLERGNAVCSPDPSPPPPPPPPSRSSAWVPHRRGAALLGPHAAARRAEQGARLGGRLSGRAAGGAVLQHGQLGRQVGRRGNQLVLLYHSPGPLPPLHVQHVFVMCSRSQFTCALPCGACPPPTPTPHPTPPPTPRWLNDEFKASMAAGRCELAAGGFGAGEEGRKGGGWAGWR